MDVLKAKGVCEKACIARQISCFPNNTNLDNKTWIHIETTERMCCAEIYVQML